VIGVAGFGVGAGVGAVIGFGVGVTAAVIYNWVFGAGSGGNGGNDQALRNEEMGKIVNATQAGEAGAHADAVNIGTITPDTTLQMARTSEYVARQLYDIQNLTNGPYLYNASYVLTHAYIMNDTLANIYADAAYYSTIYAIYDQISEQFAGTYSSMSWKFDPGLPGETNVLSVSNGQYARFQAGMSYLIDNSNKMVQVWNNTRLYLINTQNAAETATLHITSYTGIVTSVTLNEPAYGIQIVNLKTLGLLSSRYSFSVDSGQANVWDAFGIMESDTLSSGTVSPGILSTYDSGGNELFNAIDMGTAALVQGHLGTVSETSPPIISVMSSSIGGTTVSLGNWLSDLNAANNEGQNLTRTANAYAQTFYNQVVAAHGAIATPWADAVMPNPEQLHNLNPMMLQALYYSYLIAERDWFNTSHILTPNNVSITPDSANLLVRGAVYDPHGNEIVGNQTVFTPFFMVVNQTLVKGWNNITQEGFLNTWYNAKTINAALANTSMNYTYEEFGPGWRFHIEEIWYSNASVNNVTLTVHSWQFILPPTPTIPPGPQAQSDVQWLIDHWYYIAAVVGAILVLAWIPTKSAAIGVIGLVLVIAGVAGWYMSGDHSLLSWAGLAINMWGR
jgi:hypothetical protein